MDIILYREQKFVETANVANQMINTPVAGEGVSRSSAAPSKERRVKNIKTLILALTLTVFAAGSVWAADPKPAAQGTAQTKCPVLAGDVNKQVYADYKGKRVYFCCAGCDAEFKKDPEKYMQKLKEQGVTLEPAPAGEAKK
jgi:YHS domain-containing protein